MTAYEMRISDWSSDVCSSDLWTVARRELRQARPARQRLRIGYSTDLPQQRLAALLGGFAAAHPDVALETLEQPAATLSRRLQMGRIDAANLPMDDAAEADALSLFRQRYLLAVPARHALAHRTTARTADLQEPIGRARVRT